MRPSKSVLAALLLLGACATSGLEQRAGPSVERESVPRYQQIELAISVDHPVANPDAEPIEASFVAPSGKTLAVEGFAKANGFAVRFAPSELGAYHYEIRDRGELLRSGVLESLPSDDPGFLHRSQADPHALAFDDGARFQMLGENRINIYDPTWNYQGMKMPEYIAYMAAHGMNTLRVFIFSDCRVSAVLKPGRLGCLEPRVGHFDPKIAAQFDEIFDAAEKHGVYVILTAFAIGFTPGDVWKGWEGNPYAAVNGGPAKSNLDFFNDAQARNDEAHRLRYLLARWGGSSHLLAIDILNEPEWNGPIPEPVWIPWVEDMAKRWRSADPYRHLVTAGSVGFQYNFGGENESSWYASPQNDIVQWHLYGKETYEVHALAETMTRRVEETWGYDKPVLVGEFAYGGEDKQTYDHTHVGIWSSTFAGAGVLAHSAPPFSIDSDEPMTPERAAHFATLAGFLKRLDLRAPLEPHHNKGTQSTPGVWWLSRGDYAAVWLLAPTQGYGAPYASPPLAAPSLERGLYQVTWYNDVTGAVVRTDELRVDAAAPSLVPPKFVRHLAGIVAPAPMRQARTPHR